MKQIYIDCGTKVKTINSYECQMFTSGEFDSVNLCVGEPDTIPVTLWGRAQLSIKVFNVWYFLDFDVWANYDEPDYSIDELGTLFDSTNNCEVYSEEVLGEDYKDIILGISDELIGEFLEIFHEKIKPIIEEYESNLEK